MEITKKNFKEKLPLIEEAINEATFLSVDGEFTGLNETDSLTTYDTPEDRYELHKKGSMEFLMVQFGLCSFKYHPEEDKYTHKAFNFYIFPCSLMRGRFDPMFKCQTGSLEFLLAQGFDFNKVFKEGIPYLTMNAESDLRSKYEEQFAQQEAKLNDASLCSPVQNIDAESKKFVNEIREKIAKLVADETKENSLLIPEKNGFRRKLIYDLIETEFKSVSAKTVFDEKKNQCLKITLGDHEDKGKLLKQEMEEKYGELDDAVGFSKVIRLINKSSKVVVGHNMLLDVLHIVHQFQATLPKSLSEFKTLKSSVFTDVIDTKVMCNTDPFKDHFNKITSLSDVVARRLKPPFEAIPAEPADGFEGGYTTETDQLHEAGYDAYVTGLCFLSLLDYLKTKNERVLPDNPSVQPFMNKVFMMKSSDIPYVNLSGKDLKPNRDHVFHVTFPNDWKMDKLRELFSPFGNIIVSWTSNESAFVSLKNTHQAHNAVSLTKKMLHGGHVRVTRYDDFRKGVLGKRKRDESNDGPDQEEGAKKMRLEDPTSKYITA